jgi:hypothetical protein
MLQPGREAWHDIVPWRYWLVGASCAATNVIDSFGCVALVSCVQPGLYGQANKQTNQPPTNQPTDSIIHRALFTRH